MFDKRLGSLRLFCSGNNTGCVDEIALQVGREQTYKIDTLCCHKR